MLCQFKRDFGAMLSMLYQDVMTVGVFVMVMHLRLCLYIYIDILSSNISFIVTLTANLCHYMASTHSSYLKVSMVVK